MITRIALCGYPKAGKTQVQKYLQSAYGCTPIDDGKPLRDAARILYNLSEEDVSTQEGKSRLVRVGQREMTVRKLLGDLGKYLEKEDPFHLPRLAMAAADELDPDGRYVFGSVRRNQPTFFAGYANTLVVEVVRDGCRAENDFDEYMRDQISTTIENRFDPSDIPGSLNALKREIDRKIGPFLGEKRNAA